MSLGRIVLGKKVLGKIVIGKKHQMRVGGNSIVNFHSDNSHPNLVLKSENDLRLKGSGT